MGTKIAGLLLAVLILGFIILEIFGAIAGVHTFLFGESKEEREAREQQMLDEAYEEGYRDGYDEGYQNGLWDAEDR